MADSILHLVLTRFNVPTPGKESLIRGKPDWLVKRFGLFDTYCFPAMAGQTRKDFIWLVFFDSQTPDDFKRKIDTYRSHPCFTPVYVDSWDERVLPNAVAPLVKPEHRSLLTTRLDNDDGLSVDHMERLRASCREGDSTFLNFTEGTVLHGGRLYRHIHRSNAFLSRIEPIEGFQSVWAEQHQKVIERFPVRQISGPTAWLQVIHDTNVSNKVRGELTAPSTVMKSFPYLANIGLKNPGSGAVLMDRVIGSPLRALRDNGIALVKTIRGRK